MTTYTLYDAGGKPVCGDSVVDDHMRSLCDELHGVIKNDQTGDIVYPQED